MDGRVIDEALVDDFDKMATVVDWLDCCRSKDVNALLDFYADNATLECGCAGACVSGRSALAGYWEPRLSAASPAGFELQEITPEGESVVLDYLGFEGKPVRITFAFDTRGRISHTRCRPAPPR